MLSESLASTEQLHIPFTYLGQHYRQKHGCAVGSPPTVADLYMEEVENRALLSYTGTPPSHWFGYVDDYADYVQMSRINLLQIYLCHLKCFGGLFLVVVFF